MSEMYAIARQLQTAGVQTTATFNPTRLTKTLRNMTRKSIATGVHNGGWASKTKKVRSLVFHLAGEKPIVYAVQDADYVTLHTPRFITDETRSEIFGLLEADCTLQKMGYDDIPKHSYSPSREQFFKTIDDRHEENLKKVKGAHRGSQYLIIRESALRKQIVDAFTKERTVEEVAIAERIASILDRDEEFPVPTTYSF